MADDLKATPLSALQQRMHDCMIEQTREKQNGWTTHLLRTFFDPRDLQYETAMGIFSWSSAAIKTRWLSAAHATNYGGGWITPSEIARQYLTLKYPHRRIRCRTSQWEACVQSRGYAPMFSKPGVYEECIYVDLDAAYWQVVRALGWDVSYDPGKILSAHSVMLDFPYKHEKLARNCLVSMALPHRMKIWTGSEMKFESRPNKFINLILYRLVMDVLNGVAQDVLKVGAVYVYSDGYIIPADKANAAFEAIAGWGLQASVRHDPRYEGVHNTAIGQRLDCEIRAPGSYRVGSYESIPYQRSLRTRAVNKTYDNFGGWMRPRFRKFAEKAIEDWEYAE